MKKEHVYTTRAGYTLNVTVYGADLPPATHNLLYIHGFKGFKDWGFIPPSGDFFVENGFRFIAFNFSHNGIGEKPQEFTEMEKFKNNTFSLEVVEAMEMVEAVRMGKFFETSPEAKLGVIGHSRGGGISILATGKSPLVNALTTWCSVSSFGRYSDAQFKQWVETGYVEVKNSRTGQVFHLGMPLLQDVLAHRDNFLSVSQTARNLTRPWCIIHAEKDAAVHPDHAQHLFEWANQEITELHIVAEANHVFNARHPYVGSTPELLLAWNHTLAFFQSALQ